MIRSTVFIFYTPYPIQIEMPKQVIRGISIDFPFEPYSLQTDYMNKVLECLQDSQNGLLESPTGTGKTLCLLCSSLAWLESRKAQLQMNPASANTHDNNYEKKLKDDLFGATGVDWKKEVGNNMFVQNPKIIYASRTHSQLTQVIQELQRTVYSYVKVCVLGSRDQLCINNDVIKEENNSMKIHLCRAKVDSKTCLFYNTFELKKRTETNFNTNIMDIEDLVINGKKNRCCPYYMSREIKTTADIIFLPYNYLLDPKARRAQGIELKDNIIIFDEAHNLQKICEEVSSFDLTSADLASCIEEVTNVMEKQVEINSLNAELHSETSNAQDFTLNDLSLLKALFCELEDQIDNLPIPENDEGLTKPGSYIFELFGKADLTYNKKNNILDLLEKLVTYLTTTYSSSFHRKGHGLQKFSDIIKVVFNSDGNQLLKSSVYYKVHLHYEEQKKNTRTDLWNSDTKLKKRGRIVSYWCFSSGFGMQDILSQGPRSLILTSGTLSPLKSFAAEMQIPFVVQLENPHVIQKHQMWVSTICKGPDGFTLNSSYQNRFNMKYIISLGNTIVNFARVVPSGLLVFFTSYPMMNDCLEKWQSSSVWKSINQYKTVFIEPKVKHEFQQIMHDFYDKVNDTANSGAIFFAICRGKVSEGLDFSDANGRAVIVTGLPFPPLRNPKIILKKAFLNEMQGKLPIQILTGDQWYKQEASRAVNQAIGRVIRHRFDYGAIILCDSRFTQNSIKNELSSWVRPYMKVYNTFGESFKDLLQFFKTAQKLLPSPKVLLPTADSQNKPSTTKSSLATSSALFLPNSSIRISASLDELKNPAAINHSNSVTWRKNGTDLSLAEIAAQYESNEIDVPKNTLSHNQGLLAALEFSQKKLDKPEITSNSMNSKQAIHPIQSDDLRHKRLPPIPRKQVLTLNNNRKDTYIPPMPAASHYISQVKRALSAESYVEFSNALKKYKVSKNFDQLVSILKSLFIAEKRHHPLFRNFYRFIQKTEKDQFEDICIKLTGLGCDHDVLKGNHEPKKPKLEMNEISKVEAANSKSEKLQLDLEACNPVNLNFTKLLPHSEYKCKKCEQNCIIPMKAQCGDICCFLCWQVILKETKVCPGCQSPVRRKHLNQLYFS